jgi:hypothetical protein
LAGDRVHTRLDSVGGPPGRCDISSPSEAVITASSGAESP